VKMSKTRIYISGGMTGVPDYMEHFAKAQKELDFTMLDMADSIYMLKGWHQSRGANREYGYAIGKDKTIILEQ